MMPQLPTHEKANSKSAPTSLPNYAHPDNSSVNWTRRGRQTKLVNDALEAGKLFEVFRSTSRRSPFRRVLDAISQTESHRLSSAAVLDTERTRKTTD